MVGEVAVGAFANHRAMKDGWMRRPMNDSRSPSLTRDGEITWWWRKIGVTPLMDDDYNSELTQEKI